MSLCASPTPLFFNVVRMLLRSCTRAGRARLRQEAEPPLPLLEAHQGLLIFSCLYSLLGLAWPSPLAMWDSLAWGCWRRPACPTAPWLDDSGAGCIPASSSSRQELKVAKLFPKTTGAGVECPGTSASSWLSLVALYTF